MTNKSTTLFPHPEYRRPILVALALLVFALLFTHRAVDFVDLRFTMADDIDYSIMSFAGIQGESAFDLATKVAASQGRLGAIFGVPVVAWMNTLANQIMYDAINMVMFFLAIASVAAILWHTHGLVFSLLFSVVFFALFPQLWDHAPPSASPVWFLMPLLFFALSYHFLIRYSITQGHLHYSLFFLFFLLSLIQYELFVLVFPALATLLAWRSSSHTKDPKQFRLSIGAAIIFATAIYLTSYFTYKNFFPGSYGGTSLGALDPIKIASTLYKLSLGAFSPYYLLTGQYEIFYFNLNNATRVSLISPFSILDVFARATIPDWLAALSGALLSAACLQHLSTRIASRAIFAVAATGLFIALSTMLLYAISSGYQSLADAGTIFYVGSRYAYIGWIMVVVAVALFAAKAMPVGRVPLPLALLPHAALAMLVLVGSVTSSFLNERVAETMRINASKWHAVRAALECGPVVEALRDRTVVAPMLWNHAWYAHVRPDDYWRRYTTRHYGTPVAFRRSDDAAVEDQAYFTYRMDQYGHVFSVALALNFQAGLVSNLLILTPRDALVRMSYKNALGLHEERLSWGAGRVACGKYVLSRLNITGIPLDSLHFGKSEFLSLPE